MNLLLFLLLLCGPDFVLMDGWLSQYAQRPTDATIAYRQQLGRIPDDLSPYAGVIAVEDCGLIGHDAYLYIDSWYRVMIFDCLGRDVEPNWMRENNIVAEMGYYLTRDLDLIGQGGIKARLVIINEKVWVNDNN